MIKWFIVYRGRNEIHC